MQAEDVIDIALIEEHPIERKGLCNLIQAEAAFRLVWEGGKPSDAVESVTRLRPHILILGIANTEATIAVLRHLSAQTFRTRYVVLSATLSPEVAIEAMNAGAASYVLKTESVVNIRNAIWATMRGESFISADVSMAMIAQMRSAVPKTQPAHLSHRENEILRFVQEGLSNKLVAVRLGISEKTVRNYMSIIMKKVGVRSRMKASLASDSKILLTRLEINGTHH